MTIDCSPNHSSLWWNDGSWSSATPQPPIIEVTRFVRLPTGESELIALPGASLNPVATQVTCAGAIAR